MLNDPDVRNVSDVTTGDFLYFELFDNDVWRVIHIARTALVVLARGAPLSEIESLERNIELIKAVAFGVRDVGNGFTLLNSTHFKGG